MLEREFNKAKNNVINLFNSNNVLDTVKLSEIKNLKKEDIDRGFDIKSLISIDKLKLDMSRTRLVEYEYTKVILERFISKRYPYMSTVEKKVLVNSSLKKIFNITVDTDQSLKLKEDIIRYAYLIKTGLHGYPLSTYLAGATLSSIYGKTTWKHITIYLDTHDIKLKTNPTARQDLASAQTMLAASALEDIVKYDDIADYVVRTQYVLNTPLKDDLNMKEIIRKFDLEFLKNNKIEEYYGISKLYVLRDTLAAISRLERDDDKLRYIYEFNSIVKSVNDHKKSNSK